MTDDPSAEAASPCWPPLQSCWNGWEPRLCLRHEREQAHADGDHEQCGDECPHGAVT